MQLILMDETTPPIQETEAEDTVARYTTALQLVFYEGQIAWQMNVLFVGLNIGIGTILQNKLYIFSSFDPLTIFMSIIGLVVNLFWLGTFMRNNKYYEFRMAQARNAEPNGFRLVDAYGLDFSKGKIASIPGQPVYKMNWIERKSRNKNAILVAIACFIIGFAALLILSFVPNLRKETVIDQNRTIIHSNR